MRRRLVAAAVAGVVLAGGGFAYAQGQGGAGSYRTAEVTTGDVDEILNLSGTIAASARRDLSFGTSGSIKNVSVKAGERVKSGDVLAKLDSTDLEAAETKARATYETAKAQLETDQNSQSSTVTAATTSSTPSASKAPSSSDSNTNATVSPALKAALAKLKEQQTAVTRAQTESTEAITAAKSALATQTSACEDAEVETPAESDPESAETSTVGLSDECTAALAAVQAAQDVVDHKQDALQDALTTLAQTLTDAIAALGQSGAGGSTNPPSTSQGETDSGAGAPTGGSDGPMGQAVTAATLAQDQAKIDTARAELTEAERALDAAELTAPYAGEILSVSVSKGDSVGASDVVVVIKGDGATTATTTATVDQIEDVKKGQAASVTPAGADKAVTGKVTSIGLLPDTSSDTTNYPVTIELDGDVAAPEGSTASIALVTGTAEKALTVPSSAVSTTIRTTVSVLTDGKAVITPVTVGLVGSTRTSVTEGLKEGQTVILASLDAELPSGDSGNTSRFGGAGGFPGGGSFPSGFPGGGGRNPAGRR